MNISVIIPTIGRETDLIKALQSIGANTVRPFEIIIIDQGSLNPRVLKNFNLNLDLVKINKKSLTQARNIGIELAQGDIITFLDDDVILDKDYFKVILESFAKYKQVKIVQGKIVNFQNSKIRDFFWGIFLGPGDLRKSNFVRSCNFENGIYKSNANSEAFCMWASGCNMNVRRDVFEYEKFDPQMLRYSCSEDVDFSFRVYKRFGSNSILFQPKAKLIHNVTPSGRVSNYAFVLSHRTHRLYLLYKNIGKEENAKQILRRTWHDFGWLLFYLFKIFTGDYKSFFYYFAVLYQTWRHRREIKALNIEWMNSKLFQEKSIPRAKIMERIKF